MKGWLSAAMALGLAHGAEAAAGALKPEAAVRSTTLSVPVPGKTGFTQLAEPQTGIAFTNHLADARVAENQIRLVGSGVALGDVDGDGLCDLYACRLEGGNALYRNRGGWRYEDVTARAGVGCAGQFSTGCALADVDGDGDLDLLVNALGVGTRLFLNDGRGAFSESQQPALRTGRGATSLALADIDGDGDLDLYVANYRTSTIRSTGLDVLNVAGRRILRPQDREQYEFTPEGLLLEHGEADVLFLNDGAGRFTPLPWNGGAFLDEDGKPLAAGPKDWGLSVMFRDIDGDGTPDLYVCNDFWSADRIWMNKSSGGQPRFQAAPRLMLRHTSTFSMGVDFADLNRDGHDDFLVLDMLSRDHPRRLRQQSEMNPSQPAGVKIDDRPQVERNTLFVNRGDGTFAELAHFAGLHASEWSWSVAFVDVDLDGFEDALITTGHGFDTQDADTEARLAARGPVPKGSVGQRVLAFPRLHVANGAFRNRGDLTFEECAARWGFDHVGVSHGLALGDLDNDGDLDAVVNNLNGALGVYRNDSPAPRVAVRLKGRAPNTRGIGAKLRLLGGPVPQSQEMINGGRYLSSDDALRVFAAGQGANLTLEVTWRSGARSVFTNLPPNHLYEIAEASSPVLPHHAPRLTPPAPLFKEVTPLSHFHADPAFADFARQPLLPRRLSQLGPGVSWIDLDGDGREELCVGAGSGGSPAIFRNCGGGAFEPMPLQGALTNAPDDQTTILGWTTAPGATTLLVGQASYESADRNPPAARRFEFAGGALREKSPLTGLDASPGPLAAADVDGDGDLDLFVGGRVVPGHYPRPSMSRLFRNDSGEFTLAQEWPALGLVSGAVFTDLDADGFAELVLACDWGPLKIFRNDHGRFTTWPWPVAGLDPRFGHLDQVTGWWNGVASGDFDNDGRLDLIASNWGRNTPGNEFFRDGWRGYYGDFAGRGTTEIIEAIFDRDNRRVAPWRDLDTLARALPRLYERFSTRAAFSEASVGQIFGESLARATELRVNWLDSTLLLNRGDHFEGRALPAEAQWAPAFAVCVADADGDGREDAFLSQNFFAMPDGAARLDAGRGLWLRGDGRGGLVPLSGAESGVLVHGEQRGAALCDFDADGRVDLAVSQNGERTKLFWNACAAPGLRVRLRGPAGNASGLGAVLRWGAGPARELHAGSGYWSQDASTVVLARPKRASGLSIRWPGGRVTSSEVPADVPEVVINTKGQVLTPARGQY